MIPDKETLEKLAKRRCYKYRGVISSFERITPSIGKVLVSKGFGKNKKIQEFTVFGAKALEVEQLKKGFRIKVWFSLKCTEHLNKYYTNLVIEFFEFWELNAHKIKKEAYIESLKEKQQQIPFGSGSDSFDVV